MSVHIAMTRFEKGEAVTVTERLRTRFGEVRAEVGDAAVGEETIAAMDELVAAAIPLSEPLASDAAGRAAIDRAADVCINGIHEANEQVLLTYANAVVPLTAEEAAEQAVAQLLKAECFSAGTHFTSEARTVQFGSTALLLQNAAKPAVQAAIATLGLANRFALLARIHAAYGDRMGYTQPKADSPMEVWYAALERFLGAIIVKHRKGSALRNRLTEPYEVAGAAARARSAASGKAATEPVLPPSEVTPPTSDPTDTPVTGS